MTKQKPALKEKSAEVKINWTVYDIDLQSKALINIEGLSLKYQKLEMIQAINQFDISDASKLIAGNNSDLVVELNRLKDEVAKIREALTKGGEEKNQVLLLKLQKLEEQIVSQAMPLMKDPEIMRRLMAYNAQDDQEVTNLRIDIAKQEIELFEVILLGLDTESKKVAKERYNIRSSSQRLEVTTGFANEPDNFASSDLKDSWNRLMKGLKERMAQPFQTLGF